VTLLPRVLGKGAFGSVQVGRYRGQEVAVKVVAQVDDWTPTDKQRALKSFTAEVEVLGRCRHPNVVRLLAACLTPPKLCLVLELMETSLYQVLHRAPGGAGIGNGGAATPASRPPLLPLPKVRMCLPVRTRACCA
jgi:mitogen-activated protein kinase kinase kinase 9